MDEKKTDAFKTRHCPFCGSESIYITTEEGYLDCSTVIFCDDCKVSVKVESNDQEGFNDVTKMRAVNAWNRRADVPDRDAGDLISRQAEQQGRVFKEIVVEYPSYNTYPERKWIPYFSIKYTENGQEFIGYGTYKPEVLSEYLKKYFMPSAQAEIIHCRDCVYGKQDDEYNWYCRDLGCVMGDVDGSGYCSDAVKLTPENAWKKCKKGDISRRKQDV